MPQITVHPHLAEPLRMASPDYFTGRAEIRTVSAALGPEWIQVNALYFDPGVRARPHTHDKDQVLYFIEGPGIIALDGGEDQLVEEGAFVMLPAGVAHMHGAPDSGPAAHISLMPAGHANDFACPIDAAWAGFRPA
jgi:quercetin dioxygenase-like cupin family protein